MVGFGTGKVLPDYFVGDAAVELDELVELVGFFAFFFLAFLVVPDFAGAGAVADAWGADGEAGVVVPCANATDDNAVTTSAASKCFMKS